MRVAELSCPLRLQVGPRGIPLARDQSRAQDGDPPASPRPARGARTLSPRCSPYPALTPRCSPSAVQHARQGLGPTGVEGGALRGPRRGRDRLRQDTVLQEARVAMDGGLTAAEECRGCRGRTSIFGGGGGHSGLELSDETLETDRQRNARPKPRTTVEVVWRADTRVARGA